MIVRCVYASRAASSLTSAMVEDILETSRSHNPASGITGILCYSGDVFIQVLEGGRDEVCELYNSIVKDPRHTTVRLLVFEDDKGAVWTAYTDFDWIARRHGIDSRKDQFKTASTVIDSITSSVKAK